ncbi:XRE family transcriptional regulator [Methylobacterium fujisawaense]|uniref:XRE family transcriptional regulator n=1 Tax=Methylobacterium fujisawaense TaxID=107400 RepID=UPI00244C7BE8|nr:helix-turn-helix domain-containing protein [Methylobacterium fujisawaense]MDH3028307.1 helix-turn-helix domain-containing protein [Methylobacterium fujisawaense]
MGENLGKAIRAARRAKKLTLAQVAEQIGVSGPAVQQWEAGRTEPSPSNLKAVARLLDLDDNELSTAALESIGYKVTALSSGEEPFIRENLRSQPSSTQVHYTQLPIDVPVISVAVSDGDGDFYLNGEITDYVRRPVGLSYARDVYALYAMNDTMFPKYEDGDIVFVAPHTPPARGDYVVIELDPLQGEGVPIGYLRRLVKRTSDKVVVEQYNPPKISEFEIKRVRSVHRIVPWREAAGV